VRRHRRQSSWSAWLVQHVGRHIGRHIGRLVGPHASVPAAGTTTWPPVAAHRHTGLEALTTRHVHNDIDNPWADFAPVRPHVRGAARASGPLLVAVLVLATLAGLGSWSLGRVTAGPDLGHPAVPVANLPVVPAVAGTGDVFESLHRRLDKYRGRLVTHSPLRTPL
jgi:hypothetical protein